MTDLNEADGKLAIGSMARVNSYTATDGSEIATQISTIDADGNVVSVIYLPTVVR